MTDVHDHVGDVDQLIRAAAQGARVLSPEEIVRVIDHVAAAGFDPSARETARGSLRGQVWDRQVLTARTRIPADARHWLLHACVNGEWPDGTLLSDYVDSLRQVILDPESGVFINQYKGELSVSTRESYRLG
jgi:hypothetical protein